MLTQEDFKRIIDISIPIVNKYSLKWNRATLWIDNTLPHTDSNRFYPKSIKLEWIDENGVIVESATFIEWL